MWLIGLVVTWIFLASITTLNVKVRRIKKNSVFPVTRPTQFFTAPTLIFFGQKKKKKKPTYLPLLFLDPLPETQNFFFLPYPTYPTTTHGQMISLVSSLCVTMQDFLFIMTVRHDITEKIIEITKPSFYCLVYFQSQIFDVYKNKAINEERRYQSVVTLLRNQYLSTLRQWRASKRFLTGQTGAWAERFVCLYK